MDRERGGNLAKSLFTLTLLTALMTASAPAQAAVIVGDQMYFGNYDYNQGGSFTAYPTQSSIWPQFKTFCTQLEHSIYVNDGPCYTYKVTEIGYANDTLGDPRSLSEHAAWLYTAFIEKTLPNYIDDSAHEAAVQYGIWHSLGYTDSDISADGLGFYLASGGPRSKYFALGWDQTPTSWSGLGNVQVAVLQNASTNAPAQDILVIGQVPEPATLALLAIGGLATICRRRPCRRA